MASKCFDYDKFDRANTWAEQFDCVKTFFDRLEAQMKSENKVGNILKNGKTKVALLLKDVCYPSGRLNRTKRSKIDPHKIGANPSIRTEISRFFNLPGNEDYTLLVAVSGPKTRTWFSHLIAHCCTMIIWKKKTVNGQLVHCIRQFDPNFAMGASIMSNTIAIASKLSRENQDIEILVGPNKVSSIHDGHCFAINWKVIAAIFDGAVDARKHPPKWIYNLVSQKYVEYNQLWW